MPGCQITGALYDEGKRIDTTLLKERLRQHGDLEAVGGDAYLMEVAIAEAWGKNANYYAEIIRNKATLRELIHASTEILRDAWDPTENPTDIVGRAEEKIFSVHDRRHNDRVAVIHDVLLEAFARIDSRMESGESGGIQTHFKDLDQMTGGLHQNEFIVLAARPSMGKTALATNIAENIAIKANIPVLFVSLEMARMELAQRLLCSQGKIDGSKFRSGFLTKEDRERLWSRRQSKLEPARRSILTTTPSRTVTEIAACARRLKRTNKNLGMIVIDYLQLIQPDDPRDPRQEQVAKMARRLKALARELQVPVLCLAQLNRQVESGSGREEHRPRLSHLRESGAIEQDADVVMFVHREEYYHTKEKAEELGITGRGMVIIVAKQPQWPGGRR